MMKNDYCHNLGFKDSPHRNVVFAAITAITEATTFEFNELAGDILDIKQSPERTLWIRHRTGPVAICLNYTRATGETTVKVEYPSHRDGHFIEAQYETIEDAAKAFEFAVRMLIDIREAVGEVL